MNCCPLLCCEWPATEGKRGCWLVLCWMKPKKWQEGMGLACAEEEKKEKNKWAGPREKEIKRKEKTRKELLDWAKNEEKRWKKE